ncbi:BIR protein [Plasmodium berghei]|uniref:BIR protein n=2 Tax=Plasmodium berghei TaxID=5821 RepID=A0A509AL71_PLABA|nr:BIR protein [Plasmodium berghei ANKA]XP_034424499.1 BIR protein [Plasmodium berghei ANKA]CXH21659.1 BIR protein [Plasmodium berghei]SBW38359.1 BIR protein [Plasmodium berghei]SCL85064.1 BIR protein [Plasmodium berghei]VUC55545.1 BIR protein [Plasmodium berghei ANKA]VUC58776.1 BIR protein [Plasmodium berghei ANKA]|eukprot:XP_034421355.1 BIR protein [Plasmodium berghei ANKA]
MDDALCQNFDVLMKYLPAELGGTANFEFKQITNFDKYCPNGDCNTNLEKITIGFLWLLEQCFSTPINKNHNENNTNAYFIYVVLWLSYKLNQITGQNFTKINDFYTNQVNNSGKYSKFISDSNRYTNIKEFIEKQKDLLNINIEDLSKFYDASKLICSMYGNYAMNNNNKLSNNATSFVNTYTELNNNYNTKGTAYSQILSALSTDYNNLKNKCSNIPTLSEINTSKNTVETSDQSPEQSVQILEHISEVTSSSSSIGNKLFTVLSIFGAIAFFLGISYKYSLFGRRKRSQKQYLREKIKNIKKRMNH